MKARIERSFAGLHTTRFAPAPTGYLHIGHVVNAIFVWGLARALDGRVILRIEDHDRQRCRTEFERTLLEDLEWLGFEPDLHAPRQSERDEAYRAALEPLIEAGLVYRCDCTRKQIQENRLSLSSSELRYPGTCRDRRLPLTDKVGWRVRIEPGVERFEDAIRGPIAQDPSSQCGDLLIRDRLGNWTYQWAATADDTLQGITLVIRGEDLLESTGRQLRLARLLGRRDPPVFAHHALVMKSPTQKVSKSDRDTGVRELRAAGWSSAHVVGHAAWLAGLHPSPTPLSMSQLAGLFEARP